MKKNQSHKSSLYSRNPSILFILFLLIFMFQLFLPKIAFTQKQIKLQEENDLYFTYCEVNGLKLKFIFDTGATNVTISAAEAVFMIKNGYIHPKDIKGSSYSQLANGEIIENTNVILREINIEGIILHDIEALIVENLTAPLLLGQSAIKKLGKVTIEGNILTIDNAGYVPLSTKLKYKYTLSNKAHEYYAIELYNLVISTLNEAIDLIGFNNLLCEDYLILADSYRRLENFEKQISISEKYLEQCPNMPSLQDTLKRIDFLSQLLVVYDHSDQFEKGIISFEQAIYLLNKSSISAKSYRLFIINYNLGISYKNRINPASAVKHFESALSHYCNFLNISIYDLPEEYKDDMYLCQIFSHLSILYGFLDDTFQSEKYRNLRSDCNN
ncbi:MAG: retroviral-like aspartic protease family protein [Bacteroidales bacterium]|nr:retroviral-like aspartic protease family protein [Bacteroidales bacterium]